MVCGSYFNPTFMGLLMQADISPVFFFINHYNYLNNKLDKLTCSRKARRIMCTCHHDAHEHEIVDAQTKEMLDRRRMIQTLAAGGAVAVAAPALSGCATNPDTGTNQMLLIGDAQLTQMAAQSWAQAKSKQKLTTDPRYMNRLKNIGRRIARGSRRDNQPWDYAVFDSDTKNAFVLPGNHVGFYRGIIDFADNDDQVAAVMGHEVGHVSGRHAAERMSTQMAGQLAVVGGTILAGSQAKKKCNEYKDAYNRSQNQQERRVIVQQYRRCMAGAQRNTRLIQQALGMGFMVGVALPFSRKHESQADLLGVRYMHRAGYDPKQAVRLWEKMAENNPNRRPELLSTHPDPLRRARDLHNFIACQDRLGSQGWSDVTLKAALKTCKA